MATTPKAQATAARIAAAALDLFGERGFDGTTIAAVADQAGVATGTVLLHFGSKSELAVAVFSSQIAAVVSQAGDSVPGETLLGDLSHVVRELYRWYRENEVVAKPLLRESLLSEGDLSPTYASVVEQTVSRFTAIVDVHAVAPVSGGDATGSRLVGERTLAVYLLVLLQGLRGVHATVDEQVDHFRRLFEAKLPA